MWPKYGLARSTDAAEAPAALRAQRAEVMHLLEERRQVLGLGDRDVVAQLEQALVVERPAPRGRHVGAGGRVERALHRREELQLFADDARALGVVLEAGDGVRSVTRWDASRASASREAIYVRPPSPDARSKRGRRLRRTEPRSEDEVVAEARRP